MKTKAILFFIFVLSALVSAQLSREQQAASDLMNLAIPVSEPKIVSGAVSIEYDLTGVVRNETFPNHAMFILGSLAKHYPESKSIEVVGVYGGKKIVSVKAATKDVIDYAEMQVWEEDFLKKVTVTQYVSDCAGGKIKVNGQCVAQQTTTKQTTRATLQGAGQEEAGGLEIDSMLLLAFLALLVVGAIFFGIILVGAFLVYRKQKERKKGL